MPLSPGVRLGPYEILAPLGAGGMGEVFRARDTRLGRDVAVKALPAAFATDPERLARFEREAKLLASLSHPYIAGIHGLEESGGERFLILEFIDGETLESRLKQGPLPLDEALETAARVAEALEAAHEAGVIHRDLKPGNVMLTRSGSVKVLDFGLAKSGAASSAGSDPHLSASPTITNIATSAGVILGTAAYMSPEQARGRAVDRRTDIWSFGCLLYECLTGKQAFQGETVTDLVARILEREPDWSVLPANTPGRVRDLMRRCVNKNARERLRDMGDARLELRQAMQGDALAPSVAPPITPRSAQRRRLLPIATAVLVTALATVAFIRITTPRPEVRTLRVSVLGPEGATLSREVPDLVISPDGSTLAFVAKDSSGIDHVWLRSLSSTVCRVLPGTEGANIPFWSPDGRNLGFFADEKLKRIPVSGERPQVVCAAPNPRGGAWSPEDVIVFAPRASGPLLMVSANGGEPRPATTLDTSRGESAHRFPSFLPDGKHFLYVALPGKENRFETRIGTLDAKLGPVAVTGVGAAVFASPGFLVFNREGVIVAQPFDPGQRRASGSPKPIRDLFDVTGDYSGSPAVSVSKDGTLVQRELSAIDERVDILDRSGRIVGALPGLPSGFFTDLAASPVGSRIVFSYARLGVNSSMLMMADPARGIAARFTLEEGTYTTKPEWTPDGQRVIYGLDKEGGRNLHWMRADGSGGEELLADVPNLFNDPNTISPDGRTLIYRSLSGETGEDLWTVSLQGDPKPTPLIQTRFNEMDASFSPDGRWIAYRSDESGRFEVYVVSFPALDQKSRVSVDGTVNATNSRIGFVRWRRDGKEILFLGRDGQTLMSVEVASLAPLQIAAPRPLFRLPHGCTDIGVSSDGQRFYATMPNGTPGRSVMNVVMNWASEVDAE